MGSCKGSFRGGGREGISGYRKREDIEAAEHTTEDHVEALLNIRVGLGRVARREDPGRVGVDPACVPQRHHRCGHLFVQQRSALILTRVGPADASPARRTPSARVATSRGPDPWAMRLLGFYRARKKKSGTEVTEGPRSSLLPAVQHRRSGLLELTMVALLFRSVLAIRAEGSRDI